MRYTVVYDACVLYPAPIRDLLLDVAVAGMVSAKWSRDIEHEWVRNVSANRSDKPLEILQETAEAMIAAVPDCLVDNYQALIPALNLPDTKDKHVLAAAIRCHAQAIVTANLKDFPESELSKYDIEAIHPDMFLLNQFHLNQSLVVTIAKNIRARLKRPPYTARAYLDNLSRVGLPALAQCLESYIDLI